MQQAPVLLLRQAARSSLLAPAVHHHQALQHQLVQSAAAAASILSIHSSNHQTLRHLQGRFFGSSGHHPAASAASAAAAAVPASPFATPQPPNQQPSSVAAAGVNWFSTAASAAAAFPPGSQFVARDPQQQQQRQEAAVHTSANPKPDPSGAWADDSFIDSHTEAEQAEAEAVRQQQRRLQEEDDRLLAELQSSAGVTSLSGGQGSAAAMTQLHARLLERQRQVLQGQRDLMTQQGRHRKQLVQLVDRIASQERLLSDLQAQADALKQERLKQQGQQGQGQRTTMTGADYMGQLGFGRWFRDTFPMSLLLVWVAMLLILMPFRWAARY